jgi:hypothetical protein
MTAGAAEPFCCSKCGNPCPITDRIGRRDTCPKCEADLHTCHNCRHFNHRAHNECNEPQAEWVREKERANFCDYFEPRRGGVASGRDTGRDQSRARFEDLFKK